MDNEREHCVWCKKNKFRCQGEEVVSKCDFKTVKMKKEEIVKRIREEWKNLEELRVDAEKGEDQKKLVECMDILSGVMIMQEVLEEKFGMTREEVAESLGIKRMSWAEKMKLAVKMRAMKNARRRK